MARDRFGNPRGIGGDLVESTFVIHAYGSSIIAKKLKMKLAPLDPEPPRVVDRGDGTYHLHLPGMRPCRPPKPFVAPYVEDVPCVGRSRSLGLHHDISTLPCRLASHASYQHRAHASFNPP